MSTVDRSEAEHHFAQGMAWETKGSFRDALREYENAILVDDRHPRANLHLGFLYAGVGEYDLGLAKIQKARDLAGDLSRLMSLSDSRGYYERKVAEVLDAFEHGHQPAFDLRPEDLLLAVGVG